MLQFAGYYRHFCVMRMNTTPSNFNLDIFIRLCCSSHKKQWIYRCQSCLAIRLHEHWLLLWCEAQLPGETFWRFGGTFFLQQQGKWFQVTFYFQLQSWSIHLHWRRKQHFAFNWNINQHVHWTEHNSRQTLNCNMFRHHSAILRDGFITSEWIRIHYKCLCSRRVPEDGTPVSKHVVV